MPLTCTTCGISKWKSEFSRRDRDRIVRVCKSCRDIRDKEKREQRAKARTEGRRICSMCHQPKETTCFVGGDSRCKSCRSDKLRRERENMPLHPGNGSRGTMETGFLCSMCQVHKPATEFSLKRGYLDYRCKACMAERSAWYRSTPHGCFVFAKQIAIRRNLAWDISESRYGDLRLRDCFYCGGALPPTGTALDRIDNALGYLDGNVVPCCRLCNIIRADNFTSAEMSRLGRVISEIMVDRTMH